MSATTTTVTGKTTTSKPETSCPAPINLSARSTCVKEASPGSAHYFPFPAEWHKLVAEKSELTLMLYENNQPLTRVKTFELADTFGNGHFFISENTETAPYIYFSAFGNASPIQNKNLKYELRLEPKAKFTNVHSSIELRSFTKAQATNKHCYVFAYPTNLKEDQNLTPVLYENGLELILLGHSWDNIDCMQQIGRGTFSINPAVDPHYVYFSATDNKPEGKKYQLVLMPKVSLYNSPATASHPGGTTVTTVTVTATGGTAVKVGSSAAHPTNTAVKDVKSLDEDLKSTKENADIPLTDAEITSLMDATGLDLATLLSQYKSVVDHNSNKTNKPTQSKPPFVLQYNDFNARFRALAPIEYLLTTGPFTDQAYDAHKYTKEEIRMGLPLVLAIDNKFAFANKNIPSATVLKEVLEYVATVPREPNSPDPAVFINKTFALMDAQIAAQGGSPMAPEANTNVVELLSRVWDLTNNIKYRDPAQIRDQKGVIAYVLNQNTNPDGFDVAGGCLAGLVARLYPVYVNLLSDALKKSVGIHDHPAPSSKPKANPNNNNKANAKK